MAKKQLLDELNILKKGHADGYVAVDIQGQITESNPVFRKMSGYTEKELKGRSYKELSHKKWQSLEEKIIREQVVAGNYSNIYEKELQRKDGSVVPVELRTYPLRDEKGRFAGFRTFVRDITERKKSEEALRESERRFADIIDFLPDATLAIDLEGKVIAWNRAIEEMTGVKADQILGKGNYEHALPFFGIRRPLVIDLILKKDKKVEKYFAAIIKKEKDLLIAESWVPRLRGRKAFLWGKASPLYNSKGDIIGAIASIRNITERKKAEEALKESERRLADIIDFLPDATFAIDLQGRVIAWNRAIEELTGVKAEQMLGKGNYEYALPFFGNRRPLMIDLVLKRNKKFEKDYASVIKRQKNMLIMETWVPSLRGRKAFIWGKASPLYNSRGAIVGAIESMRDTTERKESEEILKKRESDLKLKTNELQELNVALRVLLKQRDNDRNELEEKILSNVKLLIQPFIDKLKNHADPKGKSYINVIESNLNDILSPFAQKLSVRHLNLTNKEVQVANLIKEGKTTKEIAESINASESSVNVHRYHIRKKLVLTKAQNLHSYLLSLT